MIDTIRQTVESAFFSKFFSDKFNFIFSPPRPQRSIGATARICDDSSKYLKRGGRKSPELQGVASPEHVPINRPGLRSSLCSQGRIAASLDSRIYLFGLGDVVGVILPPVWCGFKANICCRRYTNGVWSKYFICGLFSFAK